MLPVEFFLPSAFNPSPLGVYFEGGKNINLKFEQFPKNDC